MNDIERRVAETCEWEFDEWDCTYSTECGHVWQFIDGTLEDNAPVKFCPYCGNTIVTINTTPAGEVGE